MNDNILFVYDDSTGVSVTFLKALKFLIEKYDVSFRAENSALSLKSLIQQEFTGVFVNDKWPKIVFKDPEQKTIFMLRFN